LWTWATEADATGVRSKRANSSSGPLAEVGDEGALDVAPGEGADVVLQPGQRGDDVGREQIGSGRHDLADLHEGRAERR
jgi:hypothetical protein